MNRKILIFALIIGLAGLFACETMDEPEMETTSTYPLNGEYWVTYHHNNTMIMDYHMLILSNTAADDGQQILIRDDGTGAAFKADVNMDNYTFSVTNSLDVDDSVTLYNVNNGKFLEEAYTTVNGNETDSIHFELVYPNQGDSTIVISGFKRTGWPEDDPH